MKNLVGYHNSEKMGYSFEEASDPMSFSTTKSVDRMMGAKVWAIAGEGTPRQYALGGWFIVDEAGAYDDNPSVHYVRGSIGELFKPMIKLNDLNWFPNFRKSQSNFSLGLQPVSDEFVVNLESLIGKNQPPRSLPTMESYVKAFTHIREKLSDGQIAMLRAHLQAPAFSLTARQLADAAGYPSFRSANLQYGIVGSLLRKELRYDGPGQRSSVLASFSKKGDEEWLWTLHPPVVAALRRVDWIVATDLEAMQSFRYPEELSGDTFKEGAVQRVLVNAYERNPIARLACINHYGAICAACSFDFAHVYGSVGAGFIHVHHLAPLSSIGATYVVDPIRDLLPVCANCHAIIHRKDPPYAIAEVQELIAKAAKTMTETAR